MECARTTGGPSRHCGGNDPTPANRAPIFAHRIEVTRLLRNRLGAVPIALLLILAAPTARAQSAIAALNLPDAPYANLQPSTSQTDSSATTNGGPSHTSPAPGTTAQNRQEKQPTTAEEQLRQQEKQRILGVMATFNTTQNKNALPLSPSQKYRLFLKSVTDPWPFVLTGFVAGIDQANDSFAEYGQGMAGYARRYGASYADYFTGNFFGNAVLPSLLHEDPRYFQKGTGKVVTRALWAAASTGWCKRDNGSWGPNYANIMGNLIGAAISNVYYPADDSTVNGTIERGVTVTVEGAVGAELIEFWPDVLRHYKRKKAEKLARESAQRDSQRGSHPAPALANQQD